MSPLPEEFDIIVCGGGSCGCVVAGRYDVVTEKLPVNISPYSNMLSPA
jgi:alcohol oxidase